MDTVVGLAADLRTPVLYTLILAVVFAETAVLLGVVLPGETAAIVSGVLASQHQLSLQIVIPLVVVAAAAGDSTGYALGRHLGRRLLASRLLRRRRPQVDRAAATLRRRGGVIIVVSRFLPFLRTVTPAAAGVSRMGYLAFVGASLAGCVLWGIACPVVGYLAADSYRRVEEVTGPTGMALLALVLLGVWVIRVARRRRQPATAPEATDGPEAMAGPEDTVAAEPQPEPVLPPTRGAANGRGGGSGVVARPRRRIGPPRRP